MHRVSGADPRPFVLLLGWLGSKEQHLAKYRAVWESLGAQVFQHRPGVLQTALPGSADRSALRVMRDATQRYSSLCTLRGQPPPVLVHVMSNAGFIAYGTMLHLATLLRAAQPDLHSPAPGGTAASLELELADWAAAGASGGAGLRGGGSGCGAGRGGGGAAGQGRHPFVSHPPALASASAFGQLLRNTQGIVIDSAPSLATPAIWSQGLVSAVLREPAQDVEGSHPQLLRLARRAAERYLVLPPVAQRLREVRHAWQHRAPPCPQLYLYSKADALIPHTHIEAFMEQQAAHGVPVHHHCWADTAHCEHLRKHPEQYRSLVRSFTEHCLHSHTPPETWI